MSSLEPGSWEPNWLQGKARISKSDDGADADADADAGVDAGVDVDVDAGVDVEGPVAAVLVAVSAAVVVVVSAVVVLMFLIRVSSLLLLLLLFFFCFFCFSPSSLTDWYRASRPANCGVKPHLEAVLTTRMTLFLYWARG